MLSYIEIIMPFNEIIMPFNEIIMPYIACTVITIAAWCYPPHGNHMYMEYFISSHICRLTWWNHTTLKWQSHTRLHAVYTTFIYQCVFMLPIAIISQLHVTQIPGYNLHYKHKSCIFDSLLSFTVIYVCDIFYDIILCVCFFIHVSLYCVLLFVQSTELMEN